MVYTNNGSSRNSHHLLVYIKFAEDIDPTVVMISKGQVVHSLKSKPLDHFRMVLI